MLTYPITGDVDFGPLDEDDDQLLGFYNSIFLCLINKHLGEKRRTLFNFFINILSFACFSYLLNLIDVQLMV